MGSIKRLYVKKKTGYDVEAQGLLQTLQHDLKIEGIDGLDLYNRYDIEGIDAETYEKAKKTIFSEPNVDDVTDEEIDFRSYDYGFAVEFLPGQYDQRADSAAQCVQILTQKEKPVINSARYVGIRGTIDSADFTRIKSYYINPVESREAALEKPDTLDLRVEKPQAVEHLNGFMAMNEAELKEYYSGFGLAMSFEDFLFCQQYFRDTEKREPTITEIKLIDTYWSDHCRHTTFNTILEDIIIPAEDILHPLQKSYENYLAARTSLYQNKQKDLCLMDIAVMAMKEMRASGQLADLDVSEEINACSVEVEIEVDGEKQQWLVMFKNETHNHPTEIEPFGGAATCLGGAIRDPLSGRAYVYQAMRVTGCGDPNTPIEVTLPGKLPQKVITKVASNGYSSYGNQIGLATGQVAEVYDDDFVAKRMEVGAVMAAAPKENVVRERPVAGDLVILVGGRTGRDGCGGATGSSKEHTEESLESCGAEVQKGNPPVERKIQRFFRDPQVSKKIKRCNDFGAGGVSVAIGELTDGLKIDLDVVPKKYEGLDGTELAISESQERMAVVVAPGDAADFIAASQKENLEATIVAEVTDQKRLVMNWQQENIVDLARDFLDTNGVKQKAKVTVEVPTGRYFEALPEIKALNDEWLKSLCSLNVCSQKGLVEKFDSSIGAGTVLMPFGGSYQLTPEEGMVAKIPLIKGETDDATVMTFGYDPQLAKWSPFHGAAYAVYISILKAVALGVQPDKIRLTLQEYFEKLARDPKKWGKPFSALLGAYYVQKELGAPAIGGKDSMSGTFKDMNVPPTLISFATGMTKASQVLSAAFQKEGSQVVLIPAKRDAYDLPDFEDVKVKLACVSKLLAQGKLLAIKTIDGSGIVPNLSKMAFGNGIGIDLDSDFKKEELFTAYEGLYILEVAAEQKLEEIFSGCEYRYLGKTNKDKNFKYADMVLPLAMAQASWLQKLEDVFPTKTISSKQEIKDVLFDGPASSKSVLKVHRPKVLLPVFPGTNCEYDTAKKFEQAGAEVDTFVLKNLQATDIEETIRVLEKKIKDSQIIMLAGGFSAGDEPDGSGKFIATVFRNPFIMEAVQKHLEEQDGLILGICNGFQALIKLGLVPYGKIVPQAEDAPTLTHNEIGRHISCMARTKIVSNLSPWLAKCRLGETHVIPFSHGEGRFVAQPEILAKLIRNGQVATRYVDLKNEPTYDVRYNPNGSLEAIEGITSEDGRILGKMGHSERIGENVAKNIPGNQDQHIFEAGVAYFK